MNSKEKHDDVMCRDVFFYEQLHRDIDALIILRRDIEIIFKSEMCSSGKQEPTERTELLIQKIIGR